MDTTATISNRHTNWAAIVDARTLRLHALTEYLERYQNDWQPGSADYELHRQLIARAAFSTWLDRQALPAAPDPRPLPRLHQVFESEERCEMCGKLVGVPRGEHWRECSTPF